jgi:site-specific DNA recombinase
MKATSDPRHLVDLYLRLSVDREGKDSLERQEADLRQWVAREGLTVRRVWADRGKSGYKRDVKRPDFEAALAALRAGEAATLAVWKLDRLSRRGAGQIGLVLDDVEHVGGRLLFLQDNIDTAKGGNQRMLIVLLSEQARAESANTSLRVKAKKADSRKRGEYLGGPAPFGYVVGNGSTPGTPNDRKLRPDPEEAPLIREIVDRVLAGETLLAICRDWNAREVPTRRAGSLWRPSTLSASLRSPALAGLMPEKRIEESSGKWSTSTAPWRNPDTGEVVSIMAEGVAAIVTESERVRLLAVMDARLRRYGRGMKAVRQPLSLLGGLIVCASCKRTANTFGNSYRCRRRHVDGVDCKAPLNVSIGVIEPVVKRLWAQGLATLDPDSSVLAAVADHWLAKFDPAPLEERRDLVAQLADARTRLASADDDHYVRGTLDAERHARVAAGLEARIAGVSSRLRELPQLTADLGALLDPELSLPAIEAASVFEARTLLRLAIRRIEVTAAPSRGARFVTHERVRVRWVGEPDN